jgi:acetylornithine/N-succinyldiaminopimelate aminotransferase
LAAMNVLLEEKLMDAVAGKEKLFISLLTHPKIRIRSKGLLIAIEFENEEKNKKVINSLIQKGIFTDWFLFAPACLRIVPPLVISDDEIKEACNHIITCLDTL